MKCQRCARAKAVFWVFAAGIVFVGLESPQRTLRLPDFEGEWGRGLIWHVDAVGIRWALLHQRCGGGSNK